MYTIDNTRSGVKAGPRNTLMTATKSAKLRMSTSAITNMRMSSQNAPTMSGNDNLKCSQFKNWFLTFGQASELTTTTTVNTTKSTVDPKATSAPRDPDWPKRPLNRPGFLRETNREPAEVSEASAGS